MSDRALIFDLDGVIADTASLHRRSWERIAQRFGVPFDERINDRMRGLTRPDSLQVFLAGAPRAFSQAEQREIIELKNKLYLDDVAALTPADALPGAYALIEACRKAGVRMAVASSSRNVRLVLERLELLDEFEIIIDATVAMRSKPDPQAYAMAAAGLGLRPSTCVAIEDGQAGVDSARAAGMRVVGIAPPNRLKDVDLLVASLDEITLERILALLEPRLSAFSLREFLDALATPSPTPGGGSAASLCGGMAAALGRMVAGYTLGRAKFAEVQPQVESLDRELARAAQLLARLIEEDASAYAALNAALKLDREDASRTTRIEEAATIAAAVPLEVVALCARVLAIAIQLEQVGNPTLRSDARCAQHLARAAGFAASENVRVNLPFIEAAGRARFEQELATLLAAIEAFKANASSGG